MGRTTSHSSCMNKIQSSLLQRKMPCEIPLRPMRSSVAYGSMDEIVSLENACILRHTTHNPILGTHDTAQIDFSHLLVRYICILSRGSLGGNNLLSHTR